MCEKKVYRTNYKNLFLYLHFGSDPFTRKMIDGESSIVTFTKNKDKYIEGHIEDKPEEEYKYITHNSCKTTSA